ncbi:MAG TPA: phytanoyl-CoA dioxygenase family protein, partial [Coleofasciculaceae cyanobacterium]
HLWWNFPVESTIYERRRNAQMFHYEPHNRRSLKFLFYLTDVDLCSSPHVCVRGSHIKKKLAHRLFYGGRSHPEIVNYYGYKNIVPICGRAGFGFVEDAACFHKATPPGSKDRLILELTYFK